MAGQQCPLDPHVIAMHPSNTRMSLARVKEIEQHVSSTSLCVHPPQADLFLRGSFKGSTPLILACEEGHLDSVKSIVEDWRADVRAAANYYHLDGMKIGGVTPLFVAAFKGHTDIVRYLISQKADVAAQTFTEGNPRYGGLYPLHGALTGRRHRQSFLEQCADSNTIVRLLLLAGADPSALASDGSPVWMMEYCGVDSIIDLVECGLNLNQRNWKGETILHHWIQFVESHWEITEEKALNVVKLLLNHGAQINAQDCRGFTPILTSAECSIRPGILNFFLERNEICLNDKVDAMDLAGAFILEYNGGHKKNFKSAFGYWRNALLLRLDPKIPLQIGNGVVVEWSTMAELDQMQRSDYWIQSMLVRMRICSNRSFAAVMSFLHQAYTDLDLDSDYGYDGNVKPRVADIVAITSLFLQMFWYARNVPTLQPPSEDDIENLVEKFISSLAILEENHPLRDVNIIQTSVDLVMTFDPNGSISPSYDFVTFVACLPNSSSRKDIRDYLSESVKENGGDWLVWAGEQKRWKTLRLLLHLGADPNSSDYRGIGALHIVAGQKEDPRVLNGEIEREECTPAQLLFEYGAQPYATNSEGKTSVDIWIEKNCGGEGMQSTAWMNRPHWCRDTVPKLVCLASKTIHTHGINYSDPGAVPIDCLPVLENY